MADDSPPFEPYDSPAGGWGSLKSLGSVLRREHVVIEGAGVLIHQNKPDGFACVSCAWGKPEKPHPFEFCENGAKATAWELTTRRASPEFFLQHPVRELEAWSDHDLEAQGRLTAPMRWNPQTDRYVETTWEAAFAEIAAELRAQAPEDAVFYASGRASLEASYMYQLLARMYGNNNLPDSSNMCHESTSVALPQTIGVGVGTITLDDFEHTDCLLFFGQNPGSNSPRMLHQLQDARRRNVPLITFNPLRETGLIKFVNPQSPFEMLSGVSTRISTQYHQVRAGGDLAAITAICKALIDADDVAIRDGTQRILDAEFIAEHTHGFEEFAAFVRSSAWTDLEREAGLTRAALESAASEYARAQAVIAVYGMGLTQHRQGVENVQMLSNLLLLRGNIGRPGAGICPVRGHSNVQGQRTVGITEKPELAPLDKLRELYGFEPPRQRGLNTVAACEAMIAGRVKAFISLGGNFIRAVPETVAIEAAWRKLRLTVHIATKPNRCQVLHGAVSYILPCLGRIEIDRQDGVPQAVSTEDSSGFMHGTRGCSEPAGPKLRSEHAIIGGIAKALQFDNPRVAWDAWMRDYSLVRAAIEKTYPEIFSDFNRRMWQPGGFQRPIPARERIWRTASGRANFIAPSALDADPDMAQPGGAVLRLLTVRSNDQFNTTIYGYHDRFRGVHGTRHVLLIHPDDIARLGFNDGDLVVAESVANDAMREVRGLRLTSYDIPRGCVAGYYPECNPLIPLWHCATGSQVPAAKSIPIRLRRAAVN